MTTIRPAEPGDPAGVLPILMASGLGPKLANRGNSYHRLVAVNDDGAVLGFLDGRFDVPIQDRATAAPAGHGGPQAWGNLMAVAPEARRRGVGRALLTAFVVEAQQHGCTYFSAMVSQHDEPADRMAFFQRCGLHDLVPSTPNDLVGAPIADILSALSR